MRKHWYICVSAGCTGTRLSTSAAHLTSAVGLRISALGTREGVLRFLCGRLECTVVAALPLALPGVLPALKPGAGWVTPLRTVSYQTRATAQSQGLQQGMCELAHTPAHKESACLLPHPWGSEDSHVHVCGVSRTSWGTLCALHAPAVSDPRAGPPLQAWLRSQALDLSASCAVLSGLR